MTEERLAQIEQSVEEIREMFKSLTSNAKIPYEVDRAFRERFADITGLTVSGKTLNSEDVSVLNSASWNGSDVDTTSTSVLDDPDAWLQVSLSGVPYYIPAYTS